MKIPEKKKFDRHVVFTVRADNSFGACREGDKKKKKGKKKQTFLSSLDGRQTSDTLSLVQYNTIQ